jgi:hypothetical protein
VKFDVAVTAETTRGGGGGAKVRIAVVEADIGAKVDAKNTQVSRIQFSVPVLMPKNVRDWANEDERKMEVTQLEAHLSSSPRSQIGRASCRERV